MFFFYFIHFCLLLACQGCCVAIETGSSAGLWNDILCNSTVGAICEKTRLGYTTPTPPPTVKVGLTCPAGWTDINDGFCYQVSSSLIFISQHKF